MIPPFVKVIIKSYIGKSVPPKTTSRGRPCAANIDLVIDHIFYVLKTGCQWRMLPTTGVSWQTIHRHFCSWSKLGVFEKTYKHLLEFYLKRTGRSSKHLITDCSFVKNMYGIGCLGPSSVDRGRKASKVSIIVDELGTVWGMSFHKGNKSDGKAFAHTTFSNSRTIQLYSAGKDFHGDKAYDSKRCSEVVSSLKAVNKIARKRQVYPFSPIRARVEHVFAWLDKYRRIIVRYERHIVQYKSFTYLALLDLSARKFEGI